MYGCKTFSQYVYLTISAQSKMKGGRKRFLLPAAKPSGHRTVRVVVVVVVVVIVGGGLL